MINFNSKFNSKAQNIGFFVSNELKFKGSRSVPSAIVSKINSFLKKVSKNNKKEILSFDISENQKCFLIIVKKNLETYEINNLGAALKVNLKSDKNIKSISMLGDNISDEIVTEFAYGFELKSYNFDKYKSKKDSFIQNIDLTARNSNSLKIKYKSFSSIKEGVFLARDLVSEPPNVLNPKKYTEEIKKLTKLGLKVEILNEKQLKKLGMNSLLGVGQGSQNETFLVIVKWNGAKANFGKPLAFVGKGVCFDTGGISLKPAKFMEDMTYDMAGSAVVVGLMKSLALRKAKINAVGVVGLVENMVSGNAQRPGDIVKSYSGKTIEVLNTDAEGRLVLADALTFTEKKFKPQLMIDLATLTGAIIVSLGSEYGGLFSNDDKLSNQLIAAGERVEEKLWRMPLHKNFDKLMDSKNADMQNINYVGGAGSTTAAQFLQRFILNKTSWAHLDIAGMAFSKYGGAINPTGATGYGVRLLNQFVEDNYE